MVRHPYWGEVEEDWAGFSGDISFSHPFFEKQNVTVFLGDEYDDEGEEIESPADEHLLAEFADTYQQFLANIETHLEQLAERAFEQYQRLYAHYYENPEDSGEPALNIDRVEKHNAYLKDLMYLRVSEGKILRLTIGYGLDEEHGMEVKFVDGRLADIGGISDT